MLLVPRWEENDDDDVIVRLCDALLLVLGPLGNDEDVRDYVPQVGDVVPGRNRRYGINVTRSASVIVCTAGQALSQDCACTHPQVSAVLSGQTAATVLAAA